MTLVLKIITPEKEVINEQIDQVYITTTQGEIGILPNHADLMTKVMPGELRIKKSNKESFLATGEGFVQVKNNIVTVLTDLAIDEKDIDEKSAEEARKRAKLALEGNLSDEEYAETFAMLQKSLAQLNIKRRNRNR